MASVYRTGRTTDERSGGKLVRGRRRTAARTPYDRPPAAPARVPPQKPNWLTGLIFPTSRMVATGATKLLSSMFGPDTSSSSSSSGSDSSSDNGMDDENDSYHIPSDGVDGLTKNNGTTTELIECCRTESQLTVGKSETKRVIEKLLMQETFSREECDRLVKIINSRVIEGSTKGEGHDRKFDIPDLCSKAVREAKQWLEEKKVASSSKSDLAYGTYTLGSVVPSEVSKGELGSPVDMAKLYMQTRPPWASPSVNYDSTTPSPMGRELLKEETPYSAAGNSCSSSKKIYSLASGSWNIQEEIRRVRSKATEDMLKTIPSTKIDLSGLPLEPKSIQNSLAADKTDLGLGDKVHNLNLLPAIKSKNASLELAAGMSTCHGLPASVLEMTQDSSQNEDLSLQPVICSLAQTQDMEGIQTDEGEEHATPKSCHPTIPDLALEHDSRISDRTCSSAKDKTELRGNPNANGFPLSGSSLSAGDTEQKPRAPNDKEPNFVISSHHDKLPNHPPGEETCEFLTEASMEIPVINETDSIASGSQNTYSMRYEELQEPSRPVTKHVSRGKATTVVEKQQGRKLTKYNRKSRGKAP